MTDGLSDRRIQFRRASLVDDGFSQVEDFEDHGVAMWAKKNDVSDGERWRAGEVAAAITTRFMVPWSAFTVDLTPKDRLVCEGEEYEITGIKEAAGRRRWLEITAGARVDD